MKSDLISIIIPIYNVENFLLECIYSVINQDYANIEIILVDDGSVDRSGDLCDELKEIDVRIKVIHKSNGGLSDARNCGINEASGKYISFIDSDDFVSRDFISSLYHNMCTYNVDISCCGFHRYFDKDKIINDQVQNVSLLLNSKEAIKYLNVYGYYSDSACNKLFKACLFDEIKFPVNTLFEDTRVMYRIFDSASQIYYNSEPKYYYRQRKGSIATDPANALIQIEAMYSMCRYVGEKYPELFSYLSQRMFGCYLFYYNSLLQNKGKKEEMKSTIKKMKKYSKEMTYDGLKKVKVIQYKLILLCPQLYNFIYNNFKRIVMCKHKLL